MSAEAELDLASLSVLPRRFFTRDSVTVARALIGRLLVHETPEGTTVGRIVETEAYDQTNPASHSSVGRTPRNEVMFGAAGHAYVYFSYGVHWCVNVVTGHEGHGAAVLLRALEPLAGIELMRKRRNVTGLEKLTAGPGRLTQAMAIDRHHNGADLTQGPLRITDDPQRRRPRILATPRIGISKAIDVPWRFILADSPFVSRRR